MNFTRILGGSFLFSKFGRTSTQNYSSTGTLCSKTLPKRLQIPESDLQESFLKGTGPGGQKINKTNSAVQLTHLPTGIVVSCQATRSRDQNRKMARQILADKVEHRLNPDSSRVTIRTNEAARKKASREKKKRRKYRKLEEEKTSQTTLNEGMIQKMRNNKNINNDNSDDNDNVSTSDVVSA